MFQPSHFRKLEVPDGQMMQEIAGYFLACSKLRDRQPRKSGITQYGSIQNINQGMSHPTAVDSLRQPRTAF